MSECVESKWSGRNHRTFCVSILLWRVAKPASTNTVFHYRPMVSGIEKDYAHARSI